MPNSAASGLLAGSTTSRPGANPIRRATSTRVRRGAGDFHFAYTLATSFARRGNRPGRFRDFQIGFSLVTSTFGGCPSGERAGESSESARDTRAVNVNQNEAQLTLGATCCFGIGGCGRPTRNPAVCNYGPVSESGSKLWYSRPGAPRKPRTELLPFPLPSMRLSTAVFPTNVPLSRFRPGSTPGSYSKCPVGCP